LEADAEAVLDNVDGSDAVEGEDNVEGEGADSVEDDGEESDSN
jgi:hypothetical protein